VFDIRDDLGQGAGKFVIVDVNGNGEPERMQAFMAAVNADESKGGRKSGKKGEIAPDEAMRSLQQVQGIVTRTVAAANDTPHEVHEH